jgi:hypothetical protein
MKSALLFLAPLGVNGLVRPKPCVSANEKEPAMKTYRCDDWSRLTGVKIEIQKGGQVVRTGTADAVMPDNSIIWLAADHKGTRELFESAEEFEVWVHAHDLPDEPNSAVLSQQPPPP